MQSLCYLKNPTFQLISVKKEVREKMYPEFIPKAGASLDRCRLRLAFGGSVSRAGFNSVGI